MSDTWLSWSDSRKKHLRGQFQYFWTFIGVSLGSLGKLVRKSRRLFVYVSDMKGKYNYVDIFEWLVNSKVVDEHHET